MTLIKELIQLRASLVEAELPMDAEVEVTSGPHKGKTGYINKVISLGGKAVEYEIQCDEDIDNPEYFIVKVDQVEKVDDGLDEEIVKEDVKREYDGSHEYDEDQGTINDSLAKAMKVARSPAFKKHMRDTDDNYSTSAVEMARRAEEKLAWAIKAYDDLYDHMIEAS